MSQFVWNQHKLKTEPAADVVKGSQLVLRYMDEMINQPKVDIFDEV